MPRASNLIIGRQNGNEMGSVREQAPNRHHQIRIVIADDHPVARISVKNMLQSDPDLEVLGEASDGDEAITATLELLPDIPASRSADAPSARTGGDAGHYEWFANSQDPAPDQHHHQPADH
jgi:hypothetical protein